MAKIIRGCLIPGRIAEANDMLVIARIRLAKDTRQIQIKTGTRMQSGFGFVDVDSDRGLPVAVVAFGSLADELAG